MVSKSSLFVSKSRYLVMGIRNTLCKAWNWNRYGRENSLKMMSLMSLELHLKPQFHCIMLFPLPRNTVPKAHTNYKYKFRKCYLDWNLEPSGHNMHYWISWFISCFYFQPHICIHWNALNMLKFTYKKASLGWAPSGWPIHKYLYNLTLVNNSHTQRRKEGK